MSEPAMPLLLALYEPDIAQNAGAMMRTCACLGVDAAIIEPAGFRITDARFRRAGMDYLGAVTIVSHDSWAKFESWRAPTRRRLVLLTTAGETHMGFCVRSRGRNSCRAGIVGRAANRTRRRRCAGPDTDLCPTPVTECGGCRRCRARGGAPPDRTVAPGNCTSLKCGPCDRDVAMTLC
jgi:hypothetical protein